MDFFCLSQERGMEANTPAPRVGVVCEGRSGERAQGRTAPARKPGGEGGARARKQEGG
jgi:hypothetical protein